MFYTGDTVHPIAAQSVHQQSQSVTEGLRLPKNCWPLGSTLEAWRTWLLVSVMTAAVAVATAVEAAAAATATTTAEVVAAAAAPVAAEQ